MSIWDKNLANASLQSLVPYEPGKPIDDVAREFGLDPASVIKLASNENPLGPSPKAIEASKAFLENAHIYPDGGGYHLREAIAEDHQLSKDQVILGNGSNEIIELSYHAFTQPGQSSVVASRYAFVVYKLMAQLFNVEMIEVPDSDFQHDLEAMLEAIRPDTKMIFIASPNNPTGTRIPDTEIVAFLEKVPSSVIVILDEAYYEFLPDAPPSIQWLERFPQLILTRTFSKIQGLAALRIGYGLAHPEIAGVLQRCRQPFNANAIAQAAALASYQDKEHQSKTAEMTLAGRDRLEAFARQHQIHYIPSEANFVMMKTGEADRIFSELQQKGVIIRSLSSYGLPDWIRVSIGTPEEMTRFESEILEVI